MGQVRRPFFGDKVANIYFVKISKLRWAISNGTKVTAVLKKVLANMTLHKKIGLITVKRQI